jgi:hypothetical protein
MRLVLRSRANLIQSEADDAHHAVRNSTSARSLCGGYEGPSAPVSIFYGFVSIFDDRTAAVSPTISEICDDISFFGRGQVP